MVTYNTACKFTLDNEIITVICRAGGVVETLQKLTDCLLIPYTWL